MTALSLSLLLACSAGTTDGGDDGGAGDGGADVVGALDAVDVGLSELIPTVITVRWDARADGSAAWVDFGPEGELRWTAPATLVDGQWRASLVGVKGDTLASLVATEQVEGGVLQSTTLTIGTGSVSNDLPTISLELAEDGHWSEGFLLGALVTNPAAGLVLDPDGDVVWWYELPQTDMLGRARISRDGQGVWMMPINVQNEDDNQLTWVSWDGTETRTVEVGAGHHDFLEHEDGTLAWLTHDPEEVDGEAVVGDALTVRSPEGDTQTLWSVWDWRTYDPDEGLDNNGGGGGPGGGGGTAEWTHCNSLVYQDGAYYVGSLGMSGIMKIDAATGELLWTFGSATSDYTDGSGDTDLLTFQHQFEILDGSILFFENGDSRDQASRAVEFSFDEGNPIVEEIWTYWPDPSVYAFSLGNPQRLANGHTLVNFATGGQIDEVTPDGQVIWRLSTGLGGAFGYVQRLDTLY